ncbi:MAG: DUF4837 family protein [Flavobacteriales bacterium]|nr:DUF4837 family protein [Flavobacteriales bacterium]
MELSSELQASQTRSKSAGLRLTLFLSVFLVLASSCDEGEKVLPAFSGQASEVVIVMKDVHWNGDAGRLMKEMLYTAFPYLPQAEPSFDIIHQTPKDLSYNLRLHRNLIFVDIEDNARNSPTRAVRKESQWSKGQVVYTFHSLDEQGFIEKFKEVGTTVLDDIRRQDRKRHQDYLRKVEHALIGKQLQDEMGLDLLVHQEYKLHTISKDFAWMTRERIQYLSGVGHDVVQGIAIYVRPYTSDSIFDPESLMEYRNERLADHVISRYDEPMRVEPLIPPSYEQVEFGENYAIEGRGLWRMERPIMGGPYVSLTVVDEENARVITVDGYVFAPKFDKRNYLLDVEAIVYSLDF